MKEKTPTDGSKETVTVPESEEADADKTEDGEFKMAVEINAKEVSVPGFGEPVICTEAIATRIHRMITTKTIPELHKILSMKV